jgi:hypothetical protein
VEAVPARVSRWCETRKSSPYLKFTKDVDMKVKIHAILLTITE